jgi:hypothetical protein
VVKLSTSARSPLSPTLWPPDAFLWWQSLLFVVVLLLAVYIPAVLAAAMLIVFNLTTVAELRNPTTLTWPLLVSQIVAYIVSLGLVALVLPALAKRSLRDLGLRFPRASDLAWGVGGAVAMLIVATLAGALQESVFHMKADEVQVQWLRAARGPMIAGFAFLACVAAPIFEELTFRGFIFTALLRYLPVWLAAVASSVLFGFAHMQHGNAGAIAPLAAAGLVLTLVYYRSGSLAASMITHALFNAFTVVLVIVFHQS